MKVTIIGGGGRVGSCAAFALQCAGLVAEIQILDANQDMAQGEALDLLHGSAFCGDQKIYAGDYARAANRNALTRGRSSHQPARRHGAQMAMIEM